MDRRRMERIAETMVRELETLLHAEARKRAEARRVDRREVVAGGERLQVEVEYLYDSGQSGPVRILVSVDDGGLSAFVPVTRDTIVVPPS
jgi:hypothetical protein